MRRWRRVATWLPVALALVVAVPTGTGISAEPAHASSLRAGEPAQSCSGPFHEDAGRRSATVVDAHAPAPSPVQRKARSQAVAVAHLAAQWPDPAASCRTPPSDLRSRVGAFDLRTGEPRAPPVQR
jgi:hypothetical protein